MGTIKNNLKRPDVFALFLPDIKELVAKRDFATLKDILRKILSIDMAEGWAQLNPQEKLFIFKLFGPRKAVEVFEDLRFDEQSYLLNNLNSEEITHILNEMAPDERSRLFKDLPKNVIKKFLNLLKSDEASSLKRLLTYKKGTAGSLMT